MKKIRSIQQQRPNIDIQTYSSSIIDSIMVSLEETISTPLVVTEQETIRVKGSRVSLDSIIHHFKLGATAEQIVQSFPSLSLGDLHSSIAYYLTNRPEIEEYLRSRRQQRMLFEHNWSLVPAIRPRSPNYALAYWTGWLSLKRTAMQRRL